MIGAGPAGERDADGRERDADGRPRNRRPRDGLGRPLPRGAVGTEPIADDLALPAAESLEEAQRLLDRGRPFHAHEILEGTWKAAPAGERDLWQGLAQLAVGLTHQARGNPPGAVTLLRRSAGRLTPYAEEPPHRVDVAGLLAFVEERVNQITSDAGRTGLEDPAPRLRS